MVESDGAKAADVPVSPGEGRYLCGLLYLSLLDCEPISNGDLATYLNVSGASVTEMIETFDDDGLVEYERYGGAALTERGEAVAREILWRRCAVREFFETAAGVTLDDDRAYRIGFTLSEAEVHALSEQVDQPCRGRCEATTAADCDALAG